MWDKQRRAHRVGATQETKAHVMSTTAAALGFATAQVQCGVFGVLIGGFGLSRRPSSGWAAGVKPHNHKQHDHKQHRTNAQPCARPRDRATARQSLLISVVVTAVFVADGEISSEESFWLVIFCFLFSALAMPLNVAASYLEVS